ncbi:MAG: Co2+/Mg2+ efflux protein ApaG [Acidobacteria bacterium]|nr:MAG: Co2+/Mg2+ efflux protein ApaG [Acidobacteriota bacterium]
MIPATETVTEGIRVRVSARYAPERSEPRRGLYCFVYRVRIRNEGEEAARLLTRHWTIVDGEGRVREVHGPGVVGETPRLEPGESFEYLSACPLPTPTGSMRGRFRMARDDGRVFDAEIGAIAFSMPHSLH